MNYNWSFFFFFKWILIYDQVLESVVLEIFHHFHFVSSFYMWLSEALLLNGKRSARCSVSNQWPLSFKTLSIDFVWWSNFVYPTESWIMISITITIMVCTMINTSFCTFGTWLPLKCTKSLIYFPKCTAVPCDTSLKDIYNTEYKIQKKIRNVHTMKYFCIAPAAC